jgi:hypothetical protein
MAKALELIEVLLWAAVAYLVAANTSAIVGHSLGLLYGAPSAAPAFVLQNLIFVSPVFPLLLGVLAVARLKFGGQDVAALIGFHRETLARDALIGVAVGIASIGIAVVSLRLASSYVDVPPMHQLPAPVHYYFMTIGAVVPGVCEELYFRGLMMRAGSRLPKAVMVVLTALAFSLWHVGTVAYLPHTFLLGLIFGTLLVVSGRLAAPIIAHTVANAGMGVLLLSGFNAAGP